MMYQMYLPEQVLLLEKAGTQRVVASAKAAAFLNVLDVIIKIPPCIMRFIYVYRGKHMIISAVLSAFIRGHTTCISFMVV